MLIGIDGNEANIKRRVGIGVYAYQLVRHLYKIKTETIRFRIYLKEKSLVDLPETSSKWSYNIFGPKGFWTQIALPLHLFLEKEKPNVFFTPSHYAPRFSPCKRIISIMDLSFLFFPEMFRRKDLWQLKTWTAYSVKSASKIFTISQFSKNAILDYYKIPEDKVIVTYPGYDKEKFKIQSRSPLGKFKVEEIKNKYRIKGDYVLFVGTLQPRKNIIRLIEAFNLTMKQFNNETMQLVLVGKKGWLCEEIFNKIKELRLASQVVITNYVDEKELPYLYQGAKCLVLPSLYEGFGLPVVEAMACGTPVIVSNKSCLPEVAGDAGILVDPYNVNDIASGIYTASFKEEERLQLIKKGLLRCKLFDWEKCAKQTLKVLREAGY